MDVLPINCGCPISRLLNFTFIYDIDIRFNPFVLTIMSHIALNRGLQVLRYLVEHRSARFKDIAKVLDPISPASQMRLLRRAPRVRRTPDGQSTTNRMADEMK